MAYVTVVGAGIAGLTSAYSLQKAGHHVEVLERLSEPGGRMRSRRWHDTWIEVGASLITSFDGEIESLAAELGVDRDRIPYDNGLSSEDVRMHIFRAGQRHALDYANPLAMMRFAGTSFRSRFMLAKMLPDLIHQRRVNGRISWQPWRAAWCDDQSLASWLGSISPEFLDYVVEPIFRYYLCTNAADMSRAIFLYLTTSQSWATWRGPQREPNVFTFKEGLGQLTRSLASRLNIIHGATVTRVVAGPRPLVEYERNGNSRRAEADFVVIATPGNLVSSLVEGLSDAAREFFGQVRYAPYHTPFFALSDDPGLPPGQTLFPRVERSEITMITFGAYPTNPNFRFLRVAMGPEHSQKMSSRSDEDSVADILAVVGRMYPKIPMLVADSLPRRWADAIAIFSPGYCRALERFVQLPSHGNVAFAGDYLAGPTTVAAYTSGQRAANAALDRLS